MVWSGLPLVILVPSDVLPCRFVQKVNQAVAHVGGAAGGLPQHQLHHRPVPRPAGSRGGGGGGGGGGCGGGGGGGGGVLSHEVLHRLLARLEVGTHVLLGQTPPRGLLGVGAVQENHLAAGSSVGATIDSLTFTH